MMVNRISIKPANPEIDVFVSKLVESGRFLDILMQILAIFLKWLPVPY